MAGSIADHLLQQSPQPVPESPRISIVMPYRNAEATLGETLASIAAQTLTDYELLAIDDGSTDGSTELVRSAASRDKRIRPLRCPLPGGLVSALNLGLAKARAAWVARMDADDLMHPERLARQFEHVDLNPHITVLGTRVHAFPEEQLTDGGREYLRWLNTCVDEQDILDHLYVESPLAHPSVLLHRQRVMAAGGYRQGDFPEDYELWLRLAARGHHLAKRPDVLLDWRERPDRTSRTDPRYSRAAFDRLRASWLARDPRIKGNVNNIAIWGAGRRTRRRVQHLLDMGVRPIAWIDIDPRKIGNKLDGVPVVGPDWLPGEGPVRPFVLSYVASHGARALIEKALRGYGYLIGRDWLPVG